MSVQGRYEDLILFFVWAGRIYNKCIFHVKFLFSCVSCIFFMSWGLCLICFIVLYVSLFFGCCSFFAISFTSFEQEICSLPGIFGYHPSINAWHSVARSGVRNKQPDQKETTWLKIKNVRESNLYCLQCVLIYLAFHKKKILKRYFSFFTLEQPADQ